MDFDAIDSVVAAQAEMQAGAPMALVPAAAVYLVDLDQGPPATRTLAPTPSRFVLTP